MNSESAKKAPTPKLRFPEFRKGREWKFMPLGRLLLRPPDYGANSAAVPYSEQLPTYLRITDIDDNGRFVSVGKVSVGDEISEDNYLSDGDIVLARTGASVGKSYRYREQDGRLVFAGFLIRVRPDPTKLVPSLLASYLTTKQYWDWVRVISARSGQPGINGSEYAALPIPIPVSSLDENDLSEQQRIADCLTSLNDVIAAQAQKVEALHAHKKGLRQQIFPFEGENLPRLRLKKFECDKGWRLEKISSLLRKVSSPVIVAPDETYREIGIRSHGKGIFHKALVTGKAIGDKRVFRVVKNALVVNIVFAWEQAVATTSEDDEGLIASHRFPMYIPRRGKCDVRYVKDFFLTKWGKHLLGLASPGGAGRNKTLGQKEFEKLEIPVPQSPIEQSRIADCLSSVEELVAAEARKLDTLKDHKKGLMQQLFPPLEGIEV